MLDVRPATAADAGAIAAVYAPYVTDSAVSFETEPPDAAEITARMSARPRMPWLVAVREGSVVGYCYAGPHRARAAYRWSVEVSVYLSASEHGRGTGRALYQRLLAELRDLGYATAYAGITQPNPASVGLHESLGFTAVGVFRAVGYKDGWRDVGWWQLSLATPELPVEPRTWQPDWGS